MPSSLFDYVDGPIHPMGALSEADFCKLARIDCGRFPDSVCCGGGVDPLETECRIVGDANIEKQNLCRIWWTQNACAYTGSRRAGTIGVSCPPKPQPPTPPQPPKPPTGPLCNPASVGKRFSFNFPSGKKWTLSQKDDASARAFYCGGSAPQPASPDTIVCPDGFDTGLPIGAKTLVDPCRNHQKVVGGWRIGVGPTEDGLDTTHKAYYTDGFATGPAPDGKGIMIMRGDMRIIIYPTVESAWEAWTAETGLPKPTRSPGSVVGISEPCGGMLGYRCGTGMECKYANPNDPLLDRPGRCEYRSSPASPEPGKCLPGGKCGPAWIPPSLAIR